jgi:hypothetical protein
LFGPWNHSPENEPDGWVATEDHAASGDTGWPNVHFARVKITDNEVGLGPQGERDGTALRACSWCASFSFRRLPLRRAYLVAAARPSLGIALGADHCGSEAESPGRTRRLAPCRVFSSLTVSAIFDALGLPAPTGHRRIIWRARQMRLLHSNVRTGVRPDKASVRLNIFATASTIKILAPQHPQVLPSIMNDSILIIGTPAW